MQNISLLKNLLKNVAEIIGDVQSFRADDGKITRFEAVQLMFKAPSFFQFFVRFDELKIEATDLSTDERAELTAYFSIVFDIENDVAERKWEAIFDMLVSIGVNVRKFVGPQGVA